MEQIIIDPTVAHQDLVVELDGVPYLLQVRYNARADRYTVNIILESTLTDVVDGMRLSCGVPLLYRYRCDPNCPQGELIIVPQSGQNNESPGLGELGDGLRCGLFYISTADLGIT